MKVGWAWPARILLLICGVGWMTLAGCEAAAVAVSAVQGPPKVDALFELPPRPTAILVDDPQDLLNNPGVARQIGTTAMYYLQLNEALTPEQIIAAREVTRLEAVVGRQWAGMPLDEIGRRVGAKQIIHVKITSVTFKTDEQLYRPEATLEVKVIDCEDGSRMWPESPPLPDADRPTPGQRVEVKLAYETRAGRYADEATPADLARRLADEAGLKVARLFYRWSQEPVGSSL